MSEFDKEYLELVLKQVKSERDADKRGERRGAWYQNAWSRGLRGTERLVRGVAEKASLTWVGTNESPRAWEVMEVDCGSAFCVAGHAALMAGDTFVRPAGAFSLSGSADFVHTVDTGEIKAVSVRAQELFGIDSSEAGRLFDAHNKWGDVKTIARQICATRGEKLNLG